MRNALKVNNPLRSNEQAFLVKINDYTTKLSGIYS